MYFCLFFAFLFCFRDFERLVSDLSSVFPWLFSVDFEQSVFGLSSVISLVDLRLLYEMPLTSCDFERSFSSVISLVDLTRLLYEMPLTSCDFEQPFSSVI